MTGTAIDRRARSEYIREPDPATPGQRPGSQPLRPAKPMWVVVRVLDADAQHMLAQRLQYRTSPPVEGNIRAVGPFMVIYPPPGVVYGCFGWAVFALTDINDDDYDHSPPPWEEGEEGAVTEYRDKFNAALAYEEEVVEGGKTRLGLSPYPIQVTLSDGLLTPLIPLWLYGNVAFMEEDEAGEQQSEGMGT